MKNFTTAAKQSNVPEGEEDVIEFSIDGEEFVSFVPDETQFGLYMAAFGEDATTIEVMRATTLFLKGTLEDDSYTRLMKKLRDRKDPTDFDTVTGILRYIFEEATAFPTQPSSDSTSSRGTTGKPLTDHLPPRGSTRSRSTRAVSAT